MSKELVLPGEPLEKGPVPYDLEDVYDTEILPLVDRIIGICKEHGIPMVASFAYKADPGSRWLATTSLAPGPDSPRNVRELSVATQIITRGLQDWERVAIVPTGAEVDHERD